MATVILRPSSVGASTTGWNSTTLSNINDDDDSTFWVQNTALTYYHGNLDDLDSSLSGATINSFTISGRAAGGKRGAADAQMSLIHSTDGIFATENENFPNTGITTRTTTSRTTQQDGSSALTYAYINACEVVFNPDPAGISLYDVWVTVDYTAAAGYGHIVNGVAAANIGKVNGVETADIDKVIGQ